MERHDASGPSADEARRQLDQLRDDGRWAGLVQSTPELFQVILAGGCVLSLLSFAAAHASVGPDPGELGSMALIWVMIPLIGQGQILHKSSGSWLGDRTKRPQRREVVAVVASYMIGLVAVLWLASRGVWPAVVAVAIGVAAVTVWASGRWIGRYREEFGYRTPPGLWRWVLLYVVMLGAYALAFAWVWDAVGTWYSSL